MRTLDPAQTLLHAVPSQLAALLLGLLLAVAPAPAFAQSDEDGSDLDDDVDLDRYEADEEARRETLEQALEVADWSQRILVTPLKGETSESEGIGVLLESYLRSNLMDNDDLDVYGLEECEQVEDVDADLYYEGCPPGEQLGCQFVIGEASRMDRVISGRVTVQAEERYRVVVTILSVRRAELEFSFALDLAAGEEELFPRTVELALERLKREEILAPYRDEQEREDARNRALAEAETEEERRIVARMDVDLPEGELQRLEDERTARRNPRLSQGDLEEIKEGEGVERPWETEGLTEAQYLSFKNSNLDWDKWKWRWAGHRLMVLGHIQLGFVGGATGLQYYGHFLLDENLASQVDGYSWQQVEAGSSFTLGAGIGFGILRNLDIEASVFWARSRVFVKLATGSVVINDEGNRIPDPDNRLPGDFVGQQVNLWGGDVMLRYYLLTVPVVRPSIGAGFTWVMYPSLYNDPEVDDRVEEPTPAIQGDFTTFPRLIDLGIQLEPGVLFDFSRFVGIFLRVPVSIGLRPERTVESADLPRPILTPFDTPGNVPFGIVRVVVGVQGRILGMPVKRRYRTDEDVLEEDL